MTILYYIKHYDSISVKTYQFYLPTGDISVTSKSGKVLIAMWKLEGHTVVEIMSPLSDIIV